MYRALRSYNPVVATTQPPQPPIPPPFCAAVLAGGRSTRFGRDKARALVGGVPMLTRVLASLAEADPRVVIAGRRYAIEGVEVRPDDVPGRGPLSGLHTALAWSPRPWVAVAACDLPFLTPAYWRLLRAEAAEADGGATPVAAVVVRGAAGAEPLAALYHRRALPVVEEYLHAGHRSLHGLLACLHVRWTARAAVEAATGPDVLLNVNDPRELPSAGAEHVRYDMPVPLDDLNRMDRERFVATLGGVFESSPWVADEAWRARPFAGVGELHAAMVRVVREASEERQLALIRAHPDLAGKAAIAGDLTEASRSEQRGAGLDRLTPAEYARFQSLNRRYREKFGFPFVLAVRGHDKHGILAAFELRLDNDAAAERRRALDEIARIARFRLEDLVSPGDAS